MRIYACKKHPQYSTNVDCCPFCAAVKAGKPVAFEGRVFARRLCEMNADELAVMQQAYVDYPVRGE